MRSNRFTFAMVSLAALLGIKSKEVKSQAQQKQTEIQIKESKHQERTNLTLLKKIAQKQAIKTLYDESKYNL